jgi:hypothetical protein
MGISLSSEYSDVNNDSYLSGLIVVTTSQVEAKVGASRLSGRETLRIYNKGSTIYFGPSGVTTSTGEPLMKNQWVNIPAGENIEVFMITTSGSVNVIVQEMA